MVHKGAETIQGRKLFKGGNYMRKYGIRTSYATETNECKTLSKEKGLPFVGFQK